MNDLEYGRLKHSTHFWPTNVYGLRAQSFVVEAGALVRIYTGNAWRPTVLIFIHDNRRYECRLQPHEAQNFINSLSPLEQLAIA